MSAELDLNDVAATSPLAERQLSILLSALEFYADPETYFATMLIGDPPCGEIMDDFSVSEIEGCYRLGRRAREALEQAQQLCRAKSETKEPWTCTKCGQRNSACQRTCGRCEDL